MKTLIRDTIYTAFGSLYSLILRRKHFPSVAILPASSPGSLGDEAMVLGLLQLLEEHGQKDVSIINYSKDKNWGQILNLKVLGILPSGFLNFSWFAIKLRLVGRVYVNGADVLDGNYSTSRSLKRLRFCRLTALCGIPVTITGFSVRQNIPTVIEEEFSRLPKNVRLCCRDPLSYHRMAKIARCEVSQVSDLAFLMPPAINTPKESKTKQTILCTAKKGGRPFGICMNLHSVQLTCISEETRANWIVSCMDHVVRNLKALDPNLIPVLIAHDRRGKHSDCALTSLLHNKINDIYSTEMIVICDDLSSQAVKSICGDLEFLITGRMHCGIAALGMGIPTVFFDYQGKVKGLLGYFGLESTVVCTESFKETGDSVLSLLRTFNADLEAFKRKIKDALPAVEVMARCNVIR